MSNFEEQLRAVAEDSVRLHIRSDVPIGSYVSGGIDSSVVASMAKKHHPDDLIGFTGRFDEGPEYDESMYAAAVGREAGFDLKTLTIQPSDFVDNIRKVIFHLDYPTAGPGSFPQYMISQFAAKDRIATRHKVSFVMQLPKRYAEEIAQMPGVTAVSYANWFGGKDPKDENDFFARLAM